MRNTNKKQECSDTQQDFFSKYTGWKKFFVRSSRKYEATAANGSVAIIFFFILIAFYLGYVEKTYSFWHWAKALPILLVLIIRFYKSSKKIQAKKIYTHSEVIFDQMPIVKGNKIEFCFIVPCESEMFVTGSFRLKYLEFSKYNSDEKPKDDDFILFKSYQLNSALDLDFDNYSLFFEAIKVPNEANEDIRTLHWSLEFRLENNFGKIYKLDFPLNIKDSNDPIYIEQNIEFEKLKKEIHK